MGGIFHQNLDFGIYTGPLGPEMDRKRAFPKISSIFKMVYLLMPTPDFFEILGKVSPVGLFYIPKKSSWLNDWSLCYGTLKIF